MSYKRFVFEGDVHDSLSCVPLTVRRKLDLAGLKISLAGWQALPREERLSLCHLPVDDAGDIAVYAEILRAFAARANVPLSPLPDEASRRERWSSPEMPELVRARLDAMSATLTPESWAKLDEESKYALLKMAEPSRDPRKFGWVLDELGLGRGPLSRNGA